MANKGMVTDLSSLFPAEEVQKASMRVHDEIAERRRHHGQLEGFFNDNTNLINLIRRLPDETHHNIMVPFGKAAFFSGKMTNPNKFLVLLGEGYYAERSAKQTVEILRRRSKDLETQMESLKAMMQDLKLEASFFEKTAHESEEGLVEIREDYIEEDPSSSSPTSGYRKTDSVPHLEVDNGEAAVEDDEYARIFARMAELEKEEEEEAQEANESVQDEQMQNEQDNIAGLDSTDQEVRSILNAYQEVPVVYREGVSHGDYPARTNVVVKKDVELPQVEQKYPACNNAVIKKDLELPKDERDHSTCSNVENKDLKPIQNERDHPAHGNAVVNKAVELPKVEEKFGSPPPASNTAFTGSIIEHADNLGANVPQQLAGARSSKPVSRFKMQRK